MTDPDELGGERVFAGWTGRLIVYEGFVPSASESESEPSPAEVGKDDTE